MNPLRIILSYTLIFIALTLFSCGDPDLSGTYIPNQKNRIQSIEFKDGNARITDSFLGIKQGCMEFKVKGDTVEIKHPFTGSIIFKIVDPDTLKCELPGLYGFYTRRKQP